MIRMTRYDTMIDLHSFTHNLSCTKPENYIFTCIHIHKLICSLSRMTRIMEKIFLAGFSSKMKNWLKMKIWTTTPLASRERARWSDLSLALTVVLRREGFLPDTMLCKVFH